MERFNESENNNQDLKDAEEIPPRWEASTREASYGKKKDKRGFLKYFIVGLSGAIIGSSVMGYLAWGYISSNTDNEGNTSAGSVNNVIYTKDNPPTTVEAVAELVTPAVVGITTVELTQNMFNQQSEVTGIGSGVIVTSDGYILTNQHVVTENPKSISVSLKDGRTFEGVKIWSDATLDLAVIKIEAENLPKASLGNSDELSVGELAVAIGNPLGLTFERTVTAGIVSALNRSITVSKSTISEDLIQTDASINSGNSGGPLLNKSGEVIGINTYKIDTGEGMGFAIPINIAKPIINQIVKNGEFKPTVMGITCIDREIAKYYTQATDVDLKSGILIINVQSDSGADKAGLKADDIITKVDGTEVNTMLKLREMLYKKLPGQTVSVEYKRNGKTNTVTVELTAETTAE
ncbi:MAG: PDZ domain-containing protein [Eubacteriaceae bacterium]|nr:PDZ domain-containing protein [Eubacteriaceae bacterium]